MTRESYGRNVTRWEADHKAWRLTALFEKPGWVANRRDGTGAARIARTLDELARIVDAMDET